MVTFEKNVLGDQLTFGARFALDSFPKLVVLFFQACQYFLQDREPPGAMKSRKVKGKGEWDHQRGNRLD